MSGLTFSPGNHQYWLDKKRVPGVTTILKVLDKPALPKWAANQVAEFVADNLAMVNELGSHGRAPLVGALKEVPWQKRDDAGERGTKLHDYAERLLLGEEVDVPDELAPVVANALRFLDEWRIQPLLIEAPVASRTHWYAGTLDLIAEYTHPVTGEQATAIFDWKSGKAIYPEYAWQMAAYAFAEFSGLHGEEAPLPKVSASFGVHIREDDYSVHPLAFGSAVFEEFLAIKDLNDVAKRARGDWKKPGSGYVGLEVKADPFEVVA